MGLRSLASGGVLAVVIGLACTYAAARDLPPEVAAALERAKVPQSAMVAWVQAVDSPRPRLAWQAHAPVNPASLMKLFTTFAGLELLGPAWRWSTPVWIDGPVGDGVLDGNLVVKGSGDPTLVMERIWLLLRRVRQLGVREIRGDIVLDRSSFVLPEHDPAAFDGEPLRPQNVGPDALLLNFKSITLSFAPDPASAIALVSINPPLAGTAIDTSLPLVAGTCDDWRAGVRLDPADPLHLRLTGAYPASCGVRQWPLAHPDPRDYGARVLAGMWREIGGSLSGSVRDGLAPSTQPSFEVGSPALAEVVRDINKYSNNVMAQQLFLTLALAQRGSGTPQGARAVLRDWIELRLGPATAAEVVIDNGSGLSRDARASAAALARLLRVAWSSPVMPELMSSLSIAGVDGTLRRAPAHPGRAHLKTGSLRDVAGIAGYVLSANGKRQVVVAIVNHPNANAAWPALEALAQWAAAETAAESRAPR
ncbi:MAG: D-alanyl-D-alanine carboxypeptidase/D-alanyl-D-alanine-endopeptidase [Burkholderiaceae bacterium]